MIASQTQPGTPVPTPTVSPQGGGETDLQQFLKYYNAATPVLDAHYPPYQQQLLTLRTRLRDDFALLQSELLAWKILDGSAIHPDTEALLGIELEDEGILRGNGPLSRCQLIHEGYTNTYLGSGGGPLLITEPLTETVSFTVRVSNPSGHVVSREATITVLPEGGGHPLPTATLSMPDFPGEGGTGELVVHSADPSITWMVDFGVDWLGFDSGYTGQGDLTLPFTVAPNNLGIERSADLRVGETVLTIVQQPQVGDYTEWRDLHLPDGGGGRGPRDDYNGDGTSNFLCFCFGIDPTSDDVAARLPNFEFATDVFGEQVARYVFYQSKEATALPWQVLVTDDFSSWSEAGGTLRVIDDTGDAWLMSVERPLGNQPARQFWQIEIPWPAGL